MKHSAAPSTYGNMTGPAKLLQTDWFRINGTNTRVRLKAGAEVRVLHEGADQDGWNGEVICAASVGSAGNVRVGINPEFLEML